MNRLLYAFAAIFLLLASNCATHGATKPTIPARLGPQRITKTIDAIINNTDPNVNVGVSIRSLSTNRTIFEKNAGRHFVPCSTIKLVTLAAALYYLGPSYRFTTKILTNAPVSQDGVAGDLFIQGSGDPSLMDYDLEHLADEIAQLGIKKITGGIFVDDLIFDDVLWGRGDMWDDRDKGYAAPVSGLNLNYNRIQIKTVPAFVRGHHAVAIMSPKTRYVDALVEAKTLDGGSKLEIAIERGKGANTWPNATNDGLKPGDKIVVKGQIGKSAEAHIATVAVSDPGIFAGTIFKEELERRGVNVHGTIARRAVPENAVKLSQHDSRSLAEALIDFTKISNNVGHDTLVKAIAADAGMKPASAAAGLKLIGEFLKKEIGIEPGSLVAADGAGLSRYNLITPEQFVKLLNYAGNHFHLGAEFMAALTFVGEDGLLRSRLANRDALKGQIRAKSGTMSGLSNLAGFLTDENGERYAFAIMINGFVGSAAPYLVMQDRILEAMLSDEQAAVATVK